MSTSPSDRSQKPNFVSVSRFMALLAIGFGLGACKLPMDPSRSLQTASILGKVSDSPTATDKKSLLPEAVAATSRKGFVYSPYMTEKKLINVGACTPGDQVWCPYTKKPFLVPGDSKELAARITYHPSPLFQYAEPKEYVTRREPTRVLNTADPLAILKRLGLEVFHIDLSNPPENIGPHGWLPFAKQIPDSPGMVYSPFTRGSQIVDVTGFVPGVEVTCPYTGKLFRVPAMEGNVPLPISKVSRS